MEPDFSNTNHECCGTLVADYVIHTHPSATTSMRTKPPPPEIELGGPSLEHYEDDLSEMAEGRTTGATCTERLDAPGWRHVNSKYSPRGTRTF